MIDLDRHNIDEVRPTQPTYRKRKEKSKEGEGETTEETKIKR